MINLADPHINGYEIEERIGEGGFGAVYRSRQSTIGREVAIKIILPGLANNPDFIRRFESEAHIIARLEHHHIVPLYDYWRDPDGAYLVMRWLRGGSLHNLLSAKGALTIEETAVMFDHLTQALHIAHRNQVIHRDIKPGNILLDEDGNAFLADFGIAKDHTKSKDATAADNIMGSPDYLSPEQARSEPVTPQSDIYSLGVVLYEMIVGQHPFPNLTPIERLYKHLDEPLPEIDLIDESIKFALNDVIQKATAKNPEQRFKDVMQFAQAFREAAALDAPITPTSVVELLTPREQEVLKYIIEGKSNREIAEELVVALSTVKTYVNQIYKKLKVRSRVQAIIKARDLDLIVGKPENFLTTGQLPEPPNPYKGLLAFQAADASDFFGREKLVTKLLQSLQDDKQSNRFLAVVGPSGSGKSSVVKAGVVPALWNGAIPNSDKWYIVDMLPGDRPLDELEVALLRVTGDQTINLREQLERDEHGLLRAANLILPDDNSELLLIIDQFEEIFTLVQNEEDRVHFLKLLHTAASKDRSRVRILVTLRADYYDRPLHYPDIGELIREHVETVLPLSAVELEQVIRNPVNQVGVRFEDGLVSRIVSDVNYQPSALPLLQYALTELFERRDGRQLTFAAYEEIGGTGGALATRADEAYLERDSIGQELIRQMFSRLVTLGEGSEDTRRRVPRSELLAITDQSELMDDIIDTYTQYRLLSLDNDPETRQPTVEVAHEAILREWERLRKWLNDSRDDIRQERVIAQAANAWVDSNRDVSYLLTGIRLEEAEKWRSITELALTPLERTFITESINQRDVEAKAEAERIARESTLERRSQNVLRALVGVFAFAAIIAIGLSIIAITSRNEATSERDIAQRISLAAQGQVVLLSGQPPELAAMLAVNSLEKGYSPEADAILQTSLQHGFAQLEFIGHGDNIFNAEYTADGQRMISFSADHTARLWNTATGEELMQFTHDDKPMTGTISRDGRYAATSGRDGSIIIWDLVDESRIQTLEHSSRFTWVGPFSQDNQNIKSADEGDSVIMWNVQTGERVRTFTSPGNQFGDTRFTPDSNYVLGVGTKIVLWDVETGEVVRRFFGHSDLALYSDISTDGRLLLTGSADRTARLWNIDTGLEIRRFEGHTDLVRGVDLSPDGKYSATGTDDGIVRVWNNASGEIVNQFVFPGIVHVARFTPDGEHLITAGSEGIVRVWQLNDQSEPLVFTERFVSPKRSESNLGATMIENDSLLSWSEHGALRWWQLSEDTYLIDRESVYGEQVIDNFTYHASTERVITASNEGVVQVWNASTSELVLPLVGHNGNLRDVDFNLDGNLILTAGNDGTVRVWVTATGEEVLQLVGHTGAVMSANFSPDESMIATTGEDTTVRLWDTATGEQIAKLEGHTGIVHDVAFSPDGEYLVTVSSDTSALLWNIESRQVVHRLSGHSDQIWSVTFSPDGRYILTGSSDLTARVWDVKTGLTVRQLVGHQSNVQTVGYSPDGSRIVTADNRATYLWHAELPDLIDFACSLLPRDFTQSERQRFGLENINPVCPDVLEPDQPIEATPTSPTGVTSPMPIALIPMGEQTVFEFDFGSAPVVLVEQMGAPVTDVHISVGDGMVMRAPSIETEFLNMQLYAAQEAVPFDMIEPPYDAGPYVAGEALGFTLAEWMTASGSGTYILNESEIGLEFEFKNLLPNAVYTTWCIRMNLPLDTPAIAPCGNSDGSDNWFVSNEVGGGTIAVTLDDTFEPSTEDVRSVIAVVYHSDGETHSASPGAMGNNAHMQLVYEFPYK